MHALIAARSDISAWYCPTAFWPRFNDIAGPRLMCVPDVVLGEFPIGFAMTGVDRFASTFIDVEQAIAGSHHLVTYSEHVKRATLVQRYHVDPGLVDVIPHGANDLSALITVSGMIDNEAGTRLYCTTLLRSALAKAVGCDRASTYGSGDVRFLFYASQLRPNKNVLTLLRAYAWLLRTRAIPHKLILTASPDDTPAYGSSSPNKASQTTCCSCMDCRPASWPPATSWPTSRSIRASLKAGSRSPLPRPCRWARRSSWRALR